MQRHGLLLERHTGRRRDALHDGKVMVMRSNLRWCSDGLEFTCWNGDIVRMAFIIDAFDREIIAWPAVCGAGISGFDVRDMMLEAVEKRFGAIRAPHPSNGSPTTAAPTPPRRPATSPPRSNLVPCFTPVQSPESNGMAEAFVKTFKRDYVRVNPLPDADHRRSGRSPDGSTTTTISILTQRSGCAPHGSSSELRPNSRRVR